MPAANYLVRRNVSPTFLSKETTSASDLKWTADIDQAKVFMCESDATLVAGHIAGRFDVEVQPVPNTTNHGK
jgi:hypothetical protein